jgi:hypothetical protein
MGEHLYRHSVGELPRAVMYRVLLRRLCQWDERLASRIQQLRNLHKALHGLSQTLDIVFQRRDAGLRAAIRVWDVGFREPIVWLRLRFGAASSPQTRKFLVREDLMMVSFHIESDGSRSNRTWQTKPRTTIRCNIERYKACRTRAMLRRSLLATIVGHPSFASATSWQSASVEAR